MKQTAVEWLKCQMLEASVNRFTGEMYIKLPKDAFKKAKAMEKEQIIEAVESTIKSVKLTDDKTAFFAMGGEGYYTETYESKTNI